MWTPGRVGSEALSGRGAEDTLARHLLLNTALIQNEPVGCEGLLLHRD